MQGSYALVIAAKERQEVLRQILFIELGQRAHNAKVQRDVAPKRGCIQAHHDVAGVHVRVEKSITKHLREKQGHAIARQLRDIHPRFAQSIHLTDGHALHALHHHHFGVAVIPENFWNQHQVQPLHIAAQLRRIGGFADQIQLVVQVVVKLSHHLQRLQALALIGELLHPARHHVHQGDVFVDHLFHAGAQHLDRDLSLLTIAITHGGKVHLGNRGAGHGCAIKADKDLVQRLAEIALNGVDGNLRIKRWHTVLQLGQLLGHIRWHQVTACGQHLPKLHKNRPQLLQRFSQALAAWGLQLAANRQHTA